MPLRESRSLSKRYEDDKKVDPFKRYYILCEGVVTEFEYFQGLINNRKELGIAQQLDIILLERVGEHRTHSNPNNLLQLVEDKKNQLIKAKKHIKGFDEFVVVFDLDIFNNNKANFDNILTVFSEYYLVLTNPCFEFWLILHFSDFVTNHLRCLSNDILLNKKVSNQHTYTSKLFSDLSGFNSKKGLKFDELIYRIECAIQNEANFESETTKMFNVLSSNMGKFLIELKQDFRKNI